MSGTVDDFYYLSDTKVVVYSLYFILSMSIYIYICQLAKEYNISVNVINIRIRFRWWLSMAEPFINSTSTILNVLCIFANIPIIKLESNTSIQLSMWDVDHFIHNNCGRFIAVIYSK